MKFQTAYSNAKIEGQEFDRKKMNYIKGGQEYNRFDEIQEANVDTNIYEVLEKYNLKPNIENAQKLLNNQNRMKGIFDDVTEIQHLGSIGEIKMAQNRARELFDNLPIDIRKEFDNDYSKFIKDGEKYISAKIEEYKAKHAKPEPQPQPEPIKENN